MYTPFRCYQEHVTLIWDVYIHVYNLLFVEEDAGSQAESTCCMFAFDTY